MLLVLHYLVVQCPFGVGGFRYLLVELVFELVVFGLELKVEPLVVAATVVLYGIEIDL